jgi:enoyl-CoA hydratase/carnithine racemase
VGNDPKSDDIVLVDTANGVRTLTLNNPDRKNAWNLQMEERYFTLLSQADLDVDVRAIVVTGAGSSFCPGADVQRLVDTASAGVLDVTTRRPQTFALRLRKPMIAAINGGCAGIGLVQALCCDVRFAARGARFSTAYARRGLPAEYGTSWLLTRLIGVEATLDLLLSGRTFDAEEARQIGLVSRLTDPGAVLADAQTYAADLAANCSPRSMAAIRRQVWGDLSRRLDESMLQTLSLMRDMVASEDFKEGVSSFTERRTPNFPPLDPSFVVPGDVGY